MPSTVPAIVTPGGRLVHDPGDPEVGDLERRRGRRSSRFAGLTSRWTIPLAVRLVERVGRLRRASGGASCGDRPARGRARRACRRRRYSMTMNGRPSASPTSKIVTMCGCPESRAAASASRVKRWRMRLVARERSASSLIATVRLERPVVRDDRSRPSRRPRCGARARSGAGASQPRPTWAETSRAAAGRNVRNRTGNALDIPYRDFTDPGIRGSSGCDVSASPHRARRARVADVPTPRVAAPPVFVVTGHGWGHGIGMPQYGAHGLRARRGQEATTGSSPTTTRAHARPLAGHDRARAPRRGPDVAHGRLGGAVHAPRRARRDVRLPGQDADARAGPQGDGRRPPAHARSAGDVHARRAEPAARRARLPRGARRPLERLDAQRGQLGRPRAVPLRRRPGRDAVALGARGPEGPGRRGPLLRARIAQDGRHFDLYADTRSQVYGGVPSEDARDDRGGRRDGRPGPHVRRQGRRRRTSTRRRAAARRGDPDVWNAAPIPYLVSVADPYDTLSPYHNWGPFRFSAPQLKTTLGSLRRPARSSTRRRAQRVAARRHRQLRGAAARRRSAALGSQARLGLRSTLVRDRRAPLGAARRNLARRRSGRSR